MNANSKDLKITPLKKSMMQKINSLLDKKDLTQEQMARLLITTQPKISCLRKGVLRCFSIDRLILIAIMLGCNVTLLITERSDE